MSPNSLSSHTWVVNRSCQDPSRMSHMAEFNSTRISLCNPMPSRSIGMACTSATSFLTSTWSRCYLRYWNTSSIFADLSDCKYTKSWSLAADFTSSVDNCYWQLQFLQSFHDSIVHALYDGWKRWYFCRDSKNAASSSCIFSWVLVLSYVWVISRLPSDR